ncbi:5-hydroxytryptamine receptor 2B isoform X1 [Stomoxys calcitrans]|uniref:5-hydroxytryptamine receptor 2B isoform X1 n=1 Tax=Stomoxys calcitrans TaxID=35570 RepID=UPI0027E33A64|nr:5-hydroxytryptamine receptor 2B isoform X1 [Stomoxys calcitrans]XP_059225273.1 5-hydroxytryptamine receptor 2B isoform X1 [Stomoxys calcitrans]
MLGNDIDDVNIKPTAGILGTAAFLDVRQYFNTERDLVGLRTYGFVINDTFLLADYEETTINAKDAAAAAAAAATSNGGLSGFDLNNNNLIIFNRSGLLMNESNNDSNTFLISTYNGVPGILGGLDANASLGLPLPEDVVVLLKMITMSVVLGLMILITIIGNVFVIAAIILERNLQNVANYLVVSLAVADLFVACLVMPLGAVYEISEGWILGPELCDIWTSCDVLCCTASILHLVAIATDRYWTVTDIDYHNLRTPRRIFCMIFTVWFFAVIVSLAPQFGWKDPEYMERIEQQKCMVSQDVIYQIFATCCSFYVPLLMILVLYWKIYKIARKRIQRRTKRLHYSQSTTKDVVDYQDKVKKRRIKICFSKDISSDKGFSSSAGDNYASGSNANIREETEFSTSNIEDKSHAGTELTNVSDEMTTTNADERIPLPLEISTVSQQVAATTSTFQQHVTAIVLTSASPRLMSCPNSKQQQQNFLGTNPHQKLAKRRQQIEAKRERKAAQTLAIITGAFVVCWLPFFVMALTLSLCKNCEIHAAVASLFLWLGYFNSTLNPIIYTIFNPEFRRAFQRLLFGKNYVAQRCKRRSANI